MKYRTSCAAARVHLLLCATTALLYACGGRTAYHIVRENRAAHTVHDLTVKFGDFATLPTLLPPGAHKRLLYVSDSHPLPQFADVCWTGADGKRRSEHVAVQARVPRGSRCVSIVFAVDDQDRLEVRVEPDQRGR